MCAVVAACVPCAGCGELVGARTTDGGATDAANESGPVGRDDAGPSTDAATDASPGDTCAAQPANGPRWVFVTRAKLLPGVDFHSVAEADSICMKTASAGAVQLHSRCFLAWMSDGAGSSPSTRFVQSTGNYVRVDGNVLASGWSELASNTHQKNFDIAEDGANIPFDTIDVWTGTETSGVPSMGGDTCNGWRAMSGTIGGTAGSSSAKDGYWSAGQSMGCDNAGHIYCVEK